MVESGRTAAWRRASDNARVEAKSRVLEVHLRRCGPREREMMMRFFLYGQSMKDILKEVGATESEFLAVKERFRQRVEPIPMARQAAAG